MSNYIIHSNQSDVQQQEMCPVFDRCGFRPVSTVSMETPFAVLHYNNQATFKRDVLAEYATFWLRFHVRFCMFTRKRGARFCMIPATSNLL